ncbi:hypothetical protein ZIOFF_047965 [Zingiber officinale]|uniref:Uncharacterized protein n=1 Tax=Zingiber officinale TaxID=94328 RepID=A0A8J5KW86_ZINOF|nr:hypothetical protein ZIOFF_047965 [Zingiber officinale]
MKAFQEDGIAQASRYATEDSIKSWLNELLCLDVASYIPNITMLKIVVAAVGFKARRPEIPSTVNRHVAAIIESCWASANEAAASFHCITANTIDLISYRYFSSDISMELVYCQHGTCISTKSILAYEIWKMASEFTNLKYSRVEIDEVRFE